MAYRPMITITDNLGETLQTLQGGSRHAGQLRPLYQALKPAWYRSRVQMYRTKGRSTGFPWVDPLDSSEAARYIWAKKNILKLSLTQVRNNVLDWKGQRRLRPSLTNPNDPGAIYRIAYNKLTIASAVPHARNHDTGTGVGPWWGGYNPIPKRRIYAIGRHFTRLSERSAQTFADIVGDAAASGAGRLTERQLLTLLRASGVR